MSCYVALGDGTADATSVGLPPWPEVVEVLSHLNDALRRLAGQHGAAVAEIHENWFCNVIEPNAWGASGVREAFWEVLGHRPPAARP